MRVTRQTEKFISEVIILQYRNSNPILVNDFLSYLENVRGKSPRTVAEYELDLRTFFRFMKRHMELVPADTDFDAIPIADIDISIVKKITISDIYAYLDFLTRERDNHAAARSRKVASMRSFFKYLQNKVQMLEINPCDNLDAPKVRSSLPKYLSMEESLELLDVVDGPFRERDYCILTLFLNCGMRLSELVGINLSDIKTDTLTVIGKGNKERVVYLNEACLAAISDYLDVRAKNAIKPAARNALFISRLGNRISNKTVQHIVKKYLEEAGLGGKGYSTHKLRHTAATLMFRDGGVDLRTLQEILGHEQLSTTQIYTHVSDEQMRTAASKNPLAHVKKSEKKSDPKKNPTE